MTNKKTQYDWTQYNYFNYFHISALQIWEMWLTCMKLVKDSEVKRTLCWPMNLRREIAACRLPSTTSASNLYARTKHQLLQMPYISVIYIHYYTISVLHQYPTENLVWWIDLLRSVARGNEGTWPGRASLTCSSEISRWRCRISVYRRQTHTDVDASGLLRGNTCTQPGKWLCWAVFSVILKPYSIYWPINTLVFCSTVSIYSYLIYFTGYLYSKRWKIQITLLTLLIIPN